MKKEVKEFEPQYFGEWEGKGFERALIMIKKFLLILAGIAIIFIIAFNVSNDIWKATHVAVVNIFGHEDGMYCLTPYTCVGIVNEFSTLREMQDEYYEQYGVFAPDRPMRLYKYDSDFNAYVRWYHY